MKRWLIVMLLAAATPVTAQNAGETGAQVLQFNAGARAAGVSGAYTSGHGDADALFYNPAGIASGRRGASFAYESFSTDVAFGSLAGFTRIGGARVGASIAYLDAGEIRELVPDPVFGGQIGTPTGNVVTASETAARLSIALPLRDGRLRIGGSIGLISTGIAELTANAPVADAGVQYDFADVTISAAARNLGGRLGEDPLPTELRLGALVPLANAAGIGINVFADAISRVRESSIGVAGGVEAGILPRPDRQLGAVARIGYDADANHLARLRFGAGLSLQSLSLDYAYQNFDFFGGVHRLGLRWSVR